MTPRWLDRIVFSGLLYPFWGPLALRINAWRMRRERALSRAEEKE